jgi:hypothetical protein
MEGFEELGREEGQLLNEMNIYDFLKLGFLGRMFAIEW